MRPLAVIAGLVVRGERWALARGIALSVAVLVAGVALLGLSGWFIVAAGAAGLAGAGVAFDVFRPSAAVRFLALGRTAARYGERLLTHDATLKALALLRVRLLQGMAAAPFATMSRFRAGQMLNRITADVDGLDGIVLRLLIPGLAGVAVFAGALWLLSVLVAPWLAVWSVLSLALGSGAALIWSSRRSHRPSRMASAAAQAFRTRLIDHLRGRAILAMDGALIRSQAAVLDADARGRAEALELARIDRASGAMLTAAATVAAAGALVIGAELVRRGAIVPALAGLGFFATLALAETLAPLRRGMAELGAMRDSARRVIRWLAPAAATSPGDMVVPPGEGITFQAVAACFPGAPEPFLRDVSFSVAPGEILALEGRSGAGKSTLLNIAAGLIPAAGGRVLIAGLPIDDWAEAALRSHLGYLPQRSALIGGSIAENLRLAVPEADDAALSQVLDRVALGGVVEAMGGLGARLGEGGRGLSGGEARRLALARVLLRAPAVLLLDEPTEGLDRDTALRVLSGIRAACPRAAILLAAHRGVERDWVERRLTVT
ncbi:amino acid ABC transporter ATP-binding/permease protein [Tropicimonas sp. IMCC34043]|uniref:amino acid ABC transporter ATP-binding/permease protein n=1 Tax=Tropicimonas sp. IMCC34043 TaxID=2248760 RepID=UPI000E2287DA|nr:ATP-binding cassette domain-containing protein [Tropicimonas sp. IMCC34043]